MKFIKFCPDQVSDFNCLYFSIFSHVPKDGKNGLFGGNAIWYGIELKEPEELEEPKELKDRKIIAFCTVGIIAPEKVFLYNVGVDPLYREKGLGQYLLNRIVSLYQESTILLFVNKTNHKAICLYQKCHFCLTTNAYIPPEGDICMERSKT